MIRPGQRFSPRTDVICELSSPTLPLVRDYYVLFVHGRPAGPREVGELWELSHRVARKLAAEIHGDPECYSLLFNAARTRRRPWAHVHILLARSPAEKRWGLFWLSFKRVLRWRRWPLVRALLHSVPDGGRP